MQNKDTDLQTKSLDTTISSYSAQQDNLSDSKIKNNDRPRVNKKAFRENFKQQLAAQGNLKIKDLSDNSIQTDTNLLKDKFIKELQNSVVVSNGNNPQQAQQSSDTQLEKTNVKVLLDTLSGRKKLELPKGKSRLLLHSCCAPCSGEVMEAILASGIPFTVFFYNPNIHPLKEYEIRKNENLRYCNEHNIPFIDWDYNRKDWFERTKGMEWEPERGIRCTECFDMRFEVTAQYAVDNGFDIFTSCLGISRWKNFEQITDCGNRAAAQHEGLAYWDYNWRKNGGASRMIQISKREEFYQQEYCGCVYSLRDSNAYREKVGREKIHIGVKYYSFNPNTNDCE